MVKVVLSAMPVYNFMAYNAEDCKTKALVSSVGAGRRPSTTY